MSKRLGRLQRRGRMGRETGCSRGPGPPGQAVCVPSAGGRGNAGQPGRRAEQAGESRTGVGGARREKPTVGKVGGQKDPPAPGRGCLGAEWGLWTWGPSCVLPGWGTPNESTPRFPCSWRGHFAPLMGLSQKSPQLPAEPLVDRGQGRVPQAGGGWPQAPIYVDREAEAQGGGVLPPLWGTGHGVCRVRGRGAGAAGQSKH